MGTQINKQRESVGSVKQNLTKPRYLKQKQRHRESLFCWRQKLSEDFSKY